MLARSKFLDEFLYIGTSGVGSLSIRGWKDSGSKSASDSTLACPRPLDDVFLNIWASDVGSLSIRGWKELAFEEELAIRTSGAREPRTDPEKGALSAPEGDAPESFKGQAGF